ncbi:cupin domain-containing protein [Aquabacter sp. CN5-332]|uniref:cupin domain-containing protein n=1 Tax=Aquabacter sp. CN5-332 TaxID=3156608 RepID=UPI0032B3561A
MSVSRRGILEGVVGAGGILLAQASVAQAQTVPSAAPSPAPAPDGETFTIDLLGQPDHFAMNGCWLREANFRNFPASKGISGGVITLAAGALRELHWHANAAEWAYVLSGRCRVSIIDPNGKSQTLDFAAGDTWYFPRGYGHAIQSLDDKACTFLLAFDSGVYSEYATFSLSNWLGNMPKPVLAEAFDVPAATFDALPRKGEFFATATSPGPLPAEPASGSLNEGPLSCRYPLRAQRPNVKRDGVSMTIASSKEFPLCKTMTSALVHIEQGEQRDPHWHPNANEWQYVISGTARTTIFLSPDRVVSYDLPAGHLAYVPRGCGHFTQSIGTGPLELAAVFDDGIYESVEMTDWVRSNTAELLAANLRLSPKDLERVIKS